MTFAAELKGPKNHLAFSSTSTPFVGAFIDYIESSVQFMRQRSFYRVEQFHVNPNRGKLTAGFITSACFLLGLVSNIKFEVVLVDGVPLVNDLHYLVSSVEENIYIDDIDTDLVLWCLETSDFLVLFMSTLLVWQGSRLHTPRSLYLFLPWLGVALRGLLIRQLPTVAALLYTVATVDGSIDSIFLVSYSLLFLMQSHLCLEISRIVRARWDSYVHRKRLAGYNEPDEDHLHCIDEDVLSVEMRSHMY